MNEARDAIVIGGGFNGLLAAALLARAGARTVLVEARDGTGGRAGTAILESAAVPVAAHSVYALDPEIAQHLELAFIARDLPLVALRTDGRHLVLGRDVHEAARTIALHSGADAEAFARYRRELFALARQMRGLWWSAHAERSLSDISFARSERIRLEEISASGATAWLGSWFEGDALKAALAFDATAGGAAAMAPPSALTLLWRAAQEMSGLQSAVAVPRGGIGTLALAALKLAMIGGADVRSGARVAHILAAEGRVVGVVLTSGEEIRAPLVFSSLSRTLTRTLTPTGAFGLLDAATHPKKVPTASANVVLAFERTPDFGEAVPKLARFIVADRLDGYASAHETARGGTLPQELLFEAVPVLPGTPGRHILSVLVHPVPMMPPEGWEALRAELAGRVVAGLARFDPAVSQKLAALHVFTPADLATDYGEAVLPVSASHVLAAAQVRIVTPIEGLLLCGADAEPVNALAGRAPKLAVRLGLALLAFRSGRQ